MESAKMRWSGMGARELESGGDGNYVWIGRWKDAE